MRTKKILYNSATSFAYQFVTVICGLILPRFLIETFGSEVNGAVSSIVKFLGYISLLEAGVGGVTRAALYKPLAENDIDKVNGIVNATQDFFRKIAYVFLAYAVVLAVSFKFVSRTNLDWVYTAGLVVILSISTFSQYFFGITYSVLLMADQRAYIGNSLQIVTTILNTCISIALIKLGCGIHAVKLVSVLIYTIRPIGLYLVAKRKYGIEKHGFKDVEAIQQRWDGFGHHVAFYIHNNIDVMVVTIVLGLKWSSVYAVYSMILKGIRNVVVALSGGSEAAFGNMIAKREQSVLNSRFKLVETLTSMIVVIFFTTAGLLIFDFISIYTNGIKDIEYVIIPVGILFAVSEGLHCIKQIYHSLILAAGHYKETKRGAFIEAGINVVLSVVLSFICGLPGIIAATIFATGYRMIEYVVYLRKNILKRSAKVFIRRTLIDCMSVLSGILICLSLNLAPATTYIAWMGKAVITFVTVSLTTLVWNIVFYRSEIRGVLFKLKSLVTG